MEHQWNEIDTFSTTNPTWTDAGSNQGLRGERAATNRLSHGTVLRFKYYLHKCQASEVLTFNFPSQGRFFAGTTSPQQWHRLCVPRRLPHGVLRQLEAASAGLFSRLCLRATGKAVACFYGQLEPYGRGTASGHQHVLRHRTTLLRTGACNRHSLRLENWYGLF